MKIFVGFLFFVGLSNSFAAKAPQEESLLEKFREQSKRPTLAKREEYMSQLSYEKKAQECQADEAEYSVLYREALYPWIEAWRKNDPAGLLKVVKENGFSHSSFNFSSGERKTFGPISVRSLSQFPSSSGDKDHLKNELSAYFSHFKKIEDFDFTILMMKSAESERFRSDLSLRKVTLSGRYDLRGIEKNGGRRSDAGTIMLVVERAGKNLPWKIASLDFGTLEIVTNPKPSFQEVTAAAGLDAIPTYQRLEAIRRGGFALAVADYNLDGIPDMYVGAYGDGKLLVGTKDGKFVEATDSGVAPHDRVKSAMFADFNNDGKEDLLLVRFVGDVVESASGALPKNLNQELILYTNLGNGKFKEGATFLKNAQTPFAMPATIADFNRDGLLDVYVGFPGVKDFTSTYSSDFAKKKVAVQGLFLNKGKGNFEMQKVLPTLDGQNLFAHSALAVDFDQDGDMDILTVDDRGNLSPAYRNDGNGAFTQVNSQISLNNQGYGMGVATADFDGDGILDLLYSNVTTSTHIRMSSSCTMNWDFEPVVGGNVGSVKSLRLFKGTGKGNFVDVTNVAGLSWAGEGLAGVEFVDYNNDGLPDIVVANGLWTGTDQRQDLSHFWVASTMGIVDKNDLDEVSYTTQSPVMRLLSNYRKDILTGSEINTRPQLAGRQRNRLFRNIGGGKFMEVGYAENMDSIADGYVVAKADLNHDGKMDLIFRNGDPGTKEINFSPVQVYVNKSQEKNNYLRLSLKGTKSNSSAIGSQVKAFFDGKWHVQQVLGNNGTVQSEKTIHFGIGKAAGVEKVSIRWPSGKIWETGFLSAGSYEISEKDQKANILSLAN